MKTIKIYIVLLIASLAIASSSCNYLDVEHYFDDDLKYDSIFSRTEYVQGYLWKAAEELYDEGFIIQNTYTPGVLATDEGFTTFETGKGYPGIEYANGEINEDNYRWNTWRDMYKIIRKCNMILSRLDEVPNMTLVARREILGYTYFLRAYAYYTILIDYGPVILVGDKVYENNESADYYNNFRATYDESVDYICDELEKAAVYMPGSVSNNHFGRPTQGAAYAIIARLRLHQASPLFNGAAAKKYYGTWTRSTDGVHYVSQTYDERKWAVAAAAAKRVMDIPAYKLHTVVSDELTPALPSTVSSNSFPNGAGDIDPFRSYSDMFTGESMIYRIPEFIWARRFSDDNWTRSVFPARLGGWNGGLGVTQKVVDSYLMADGHTIYNSSPEYPYDESEMVSMNGKNFSGYRFTIAKRINGMYVNREPRFYASIGFSGRFWPSLSARESSDREYTAWYDRGGRDGKHGGDENSSDDYPGTGFTLTKMVHINDSYREGGRVYEKAFPIIRYAEVLLIYAEALNNLTQSHTITLGEGVNSYTATVSREPAEMGFAFNQVRFRAGLPGLTETELSDASTIQQLIRRERMVEFLFENRRYYDVRRWGIYEEVESEPMLGMNIEAYEPEFYTRTFVNHTNARNKIALPKMILLPIPKGEIRKIENCDQNYGWGN